MAIHIHIHRNTKDASASQSTARAELEATRRERLRAMMKRGEKIDDPTARSAGFRNAEEAMRKLGAKDSVLSVEKEIAAQQRLVEAAKKAGKEVPGQVQQRLKFLQEELAKAKAAE